MSGVLIRISAFDIFLVYPFSQEQNKNGILVSERSKAGFLLTFPRIPRESSKNIVSAFHNGNRGPFVITFGVKCMSCEAISRTTEK